VDAREQLRRYLEQRREMGERELVLDAMSVDDALAVVTGKRKNEGSRATSESSARIETANEMSGPGDWRATLRAAGAGPGSGSPTSDSSSGAEPATAVPPLPPSRSPAMSVAAPSAELFGGSLADVETLEEIASLIASCKKCPLYKTATNPVPGEGNPRAKLMCVGEAPGATEDETGRPFVGAAGQLLTKILAAIDLPRDQVYICNVLKHRPPGNRNPESDEVTACSPYLIRQIELIRPRVILALGTFAAQTLLNTKTAIGKLRGSVHEYHGVPLVVTYHPAALLRNPGWKRPTWEDVQLARRILDRSNAGA
jgi:uracil-DNA glycosylase